MALDGKAIKEEIPDKEVYDSGSVRRAKGESTSDILITQLEDIFSRLNDSCVCLLCVIEVLSLPLINQLVTGKKFPLSTPSIYRRIKIYHKKVHTARYSLFCCCFYFEADGYKSRFNEPVKYIGW